MVMKRSPGCTCECGTPVCADFDAITTLEISTASGYCAACNGIDGTYIMRTVGDSFLSGSTCFRYSNLLTTDGTCSPQYAAAISCGATVPAQFSQFIFSLSLAGSNLVAQFSISTLYSSGASASDPASYYVATFKKTSATASGLLGVLPFFSGGDNVYCNSGAYGDQCDYSGMTVTLS
jgi:hypothetical protein